MASSPYDGVQMKRRLRLQAVVQPTADARGVTIRPPWLKQTAIAIAVGGPIFLGLGILDQLFPDERPTMTIREALLVGGIGVVIAGSIFATVQALTFVRAGPLGLVISDGGRRTTLAWDRIERVDLDADEDELRVSLIDGTQRTFPVGFISRLRDPVVLAALARTCSLYLAPSALSGMSPS
jgi:hypothetical protein